MKNPTGHPSHALRLISLFLFLACLQTQAGSWLTNAPMFSSRQNQTATLLSNGKVLVAGGESNQVSLASAELFDPLTGTWTTTGSMGTPRAAHTATLLLNGMVLVAGGRNSTNLSQAELYDPASGTWTDTGVAQVPRYQHTATLLLDGKVLVAGGIGPFIGAEDKTNSTELFDPATGTWSQVGPLNIARAWHTATLLPNGQVLAISGEGRDGTPITSVELYDPTNAVWTKIAPLAVARRYHTTTLLRNGQALVAGGEMIDPPFALSSAEIFDPTAGTWTTANSMSAGHARHTATLLPDGRLLVAAGETDYFAITNRAELYDPSTGAWTGAAPEKGARENGTGTLLPSGKVLIAGGEDENGTVATTELYDSTIVPTTGTWTNTGSMQFSRRSFTMTPLPDGTALAAGGEDGHGTYRSSAEIYNPATRLWTNTGALNAARFHHSATLLPNGKVLVAGGVGSSLFMFSAEFYDPTTGVWTTTGAMHAPHFAHTATLLRNGKVLLAGYGSGGSSAELYDWTTGSWSVTGNMITPRSFHRATLLPNGTVLVVGGSQNSTDLSSAEIYDPGAGQWNNAGQTRAAASVFTAISLLPNGMVLVAGSSANALPVADLFDPSTSLWTSAQPPKASHFLPTLTPLPNGKILLAGDGGSPETFDPATGQWMITKNMNQDRYDQRALLLPDGNMLVAGGYYSDGLTNAELYNVGLGFADSWRPQIFAATSLLNLGNSVTVTGSGFRGWSEGSSGNAQDSSTDYPLVQLRSIENGQTAFLSATNWSTNSFASAPAWNFPPGYALATVFVGGIQSTSSIININVTIPAITTLTATTLTNGWFQFTFTNNPGAMFGVLTSTNAALPGSNWTTLGGVTELSPGYFQFTDPQAANIRQRFYRLVTP